MKTKEVYIQTIGCQMNVYDSGKMIDMLCSYNFTQTGAISNADLIIINTCAIREKAVQKVYSFIGRLNYLKKRKKALIIVVAGCVAQQQGQALIDRFPYIDIVLGTHAVHRLPELIQEAQHSGTPVIDIEMRADISEYRASCISTHQHSDVNRFVTIMRGCDNYCTYCVVPYVRGREVSRRPDDIITEITALVQSGVKEITLLGQNVNSYGLKEGLVSFPQLLEMVNEVEELKRIRFVTSHPKDLSDSLIESFSRLEKLCNHIHLPVQSGSNQILEKMNRKYTRELYIEKINRLREVSPGISITTDIIVGFPGESQKDFELTLQLLEAVRFDNLFVFEYSERPNTLASAFPDKISSNVKNERLQEVLRLQQNISREKDSFLIGKIFPILVEGNSKKQLKKNSKLLQYDIELSGRTCENKIVNFNMIIDKGLDINLLKGQIINLKIDHICSNSLWGTPVV